MIQIDFDARRKELILQNKKEVINLIDKLQNKYQKKDYQGIWNNLNDYQQKHIIKSAEINVVELEDIIDNIFINECFAVTTLAKDPTRMVFQEKLQYDCLSNQSLIGQNWNNLPNSGKNIRSLTDKGEICIGRGRTKSLDFCAQDKDGIDI